MSVESDDQQQVEPYSEVQIGPDEVVQIIITTDQKHLYVLSKHKVSNIYNHVIVH